MNITLVHGQKVRLKVKNPLYPIRDGPWVTSVQNEFNYHEGEVRFENWYQPNEVGLKPNFFNRGIDLEDIVEVVVLPQEVVDLTHLQNDPVFVDMTDDP